MKPINLILSSFSIVLCLILLYFLLTTDLFIDRLHGSKRTIMTVVLIAYAGFRLFRLYKLVKK